MLNEDIVLYSAISLIMLLPRVTSVDCITLTVFYQGIQHIKYHLAQKP